VADRGNSIPKERSIPGCDRERQFAGELQNESFLVFSDLLPQVNSSGNVVRSEIFGRS